LTARELDVLVLLDDPAQRAVVSARPYRSRS
jgi:hypothetical protein